MTASEPEATTVDLASVSTITNVLIAFDASTIVEKYPNASKNHDHPTGLRPQDVKDLIYMTVKRDHIIGEPGGNLNFSAKVGDLVRWRETTFSLNFDYSALLYKFRPISGTENITQPQCRLSKPDMPYPDCPNNPTNVKHQTVYNHFWSAEVLSRGTVTYDWCFQILERGELKGCFGWDPTITIK